MGSNSELGGGRVVSPTLSVTLSTHCSSVEPDDFKRAGSVRRLQSTQWTSYGRQKCQDGCPLPLPPPLGDVLSCPTPRARLFGAIMYPH